MSNDSKKDNETHQEFDGIIEQNNPLPGWWVGKFYLTIIFASLYFAYYQLGSGPSLVEEYAQEVDSVQKKNHPESGAVAVAVLDNESIKKMMAKSGSIEAGRTNFATKCISCHGAKGEGGIGPNLTDEYWIHGSKPIDLYTTIKNGVNDKGMPPWGSLLKDEEMVQLVAFVKSLKGTNPPQAKAPQGEKSTD